MPQTVCSHLDISLTLFNDWERFQHPIDLIETSKNLPIYRIIMLLHS